MSLPILLLISQMKSIFIHNPTLSKFGKSLFSVRELSVNTAKKTLENFQESIDLLVFSSFSPEVYTKEFNLPSKIAGDLFLDNPYTLRTETASSSGACAFHLAYYLLQSGHFKNALVIGTEIMTGLGREENNLILGSVLSENQMNYSTSMAQGAALICRRYMHEFNYTKKDLFFISEKLHANGALNENAHIRKRITWEDYSKAPIFSSPLGLYDISPLSDGSASLILSVTQKSEFRVKGLGHGISRFFNPPYSLSFEASIKAFIQAYNNSNIKPSDIDIAELHDAFTIFEAIGMEDGGLAEKGKALDIIKSGITHSSGSLPINASGGLKSRGHPIGASGLAQIVEIQTHMKKLNKHIGLTHSIGGLATNNFVTIIEYAT